MKRSLYSGRDGEPDMPFTPGVESSFPEGASTQDPLEPAAWAPSQNDISSSAPTVSPAMETLLPVSAGQANVAPSSVGQQNWEEKIFSLPLVGRAPILCARAAAAAFRLRRRPTAASVKASSHVTAATNYEQENDLWQVFVEENWAPLLSSEFGQDWRSRYPSEVTALLWWAISQNAPNRHMLPLCDFSVPEHSASCSARRGSHCCPSAITGCDTSCRMPSGVRKDGGAELMTLLQRRLEAQLGATAADAEPAPRAAMTPNDPGSVCWIPRDGAAPAHAPQLLSLGLQLADGEKLKKLLSRPGIDGRTALHAAAASGREDVVEKLLLLGCDPQQRLGTDSLKPSTRSRVHQGASGSRHFDFASSHVYPIFHQTGSKNIASSAPSPVFPWKWPSPPLSVVPNTTLRAATPASTTPAGVTSCTVAPSTAPCHPGTVTSSLDTACKVVKAATAVRTGTLEQQEKGTSEQDDQQRDQRQKQDDVGSSQVLFPPPSLSTSPALAPLPASQQPSPGPTPMPGLQQTPVSVQGLQHASSIGLLQFPVGAEDSDESLDLDPDFGVAGAPLSSHSWNGGPPDGSCLHSCDAWEADSDDTSPFGDADDGFCCGVESDIQDGFPGLQICKLRDQPKRAEAQSQGLQPAQRKPRTRSSSADPKTPSAAAADLRHVPTLLLASPLCVAARYGQLGVVEALLRVRGCDVHDATSAGATPLMLAAYGGFAAVVNRLAQGLTPAQLDVRDLLGHTALQYAAANGHTSCVEALWPRGAGLDLTNLQGSSALHLASRYNHTNVVSKLVIAGCHVSLKDGSGATAAALAAAAGHLAVLDKLLLAGADIRPTFAAPVAPQAQAQPAAATTAAPAAAAVAAVPVLPSIHSAALQGLDQALLQLLGAAGCDVNARDSDGMTPLMLAAQGGHTKVASLLVSEGGDVDAQSANGNTALMNAVSGAHLDVATLLLSVGADTDIQNVNGNTALHISCAKAGQAEILLKLVAHGCDVHIRNSKAWQAIHSAASAGWMDMVLHLIAAGAAWRPSRASMLAGAAGGAASTDLDVVKMLCRKSSAKPSYIEGRLRLAESARQRGRSMLNKTATALLDSAADLTASVRATHGKDQGTSPASEGADAVVSDDSSAAATGTPRQRGPASVASNGGSPVAAARKHALDIAGLSSHETNRIQTAVADANMAELIEEEKTAAAAAKQAAEKKRVKKKKGKDNTAAKTCAALPTPVQCSLHAATVGECPTALPAQAAQQQPSVSVPVDGESKDTGPDAGGGARRKGVAQQLPSANHPTAVVSSADAHTTVAPAAHISVSLKLSAPSALSTAAAVIAGVAKALRVKPGGQQQAQQTQQQQQLSRVSEQVLKATALLPSSQTKQQQEQQQLQQQHKQQKRAETAAKKVQPARAPVCEASSKPSQAQLTHPERSAAKSKPVPAAPSQAPGRKQTQTPAAMSLPAESNASKEQDMGQKPTSPLHVAGLSHTPPATAKREAAAKPQPLVASRPQGAVTSHPQPPVSLTPKQTQSLASLINPQAAGKASVDSPKRTSPASSRATAAPSATAAALLGSRAPPLVSTAPSLSPVNSVPPPTGPAAGDLLKLRLQLGEPAPPHQKASLHITENNTSPVSTPAAHASALEHPQSVYAGTASTAQLHSRAAVVLHPRQSRSLLDCSQQACSDAVAPTAAELRPVTAPQPRSTAAASWGDLLASHPAIAHSSSLQSVMSWQAPAHTICRPVASMYASNSFFSESLFSAAAQPDFGQTQHQPEKSEIDIASLLGASYLDPHALRFHSPAPTHITDMPTQEIGTRPACPPARAIGMGRSSNACSDRPSANGVGLSKVIHGLQLQQPPAGQHSSVQSSRCWGEDSIPTQPVLVPVQSIPSSFQPHQYQTNPGSSLGRLFMPYPSSFDPCAAAASATVLSASLPHMARQPGVEPAEPAEHQYFMSAGPSIDWSFSVPASSSAASKGEAVKWDNISAESLSDVLQKPNGSILDNGRIPQPPRTTPTPPKAVKVDGTHSAVNAANSGSSSTLRAPGNIPQTSVHAGGPALSAQPRAADLNVVSQLPRTNRSAQTQAPSNGTDASALAAVTHRPSNLPAATQPATYGKSSKAGFCPEHGSYRPNGHHPNPSPVPEQQQQSHAVHARHTVGLEVPGWQERQLWNNNPHNHHTQDATRNRPGRDSLTGTPATGRGALGTGPPNRFTNTDHTAAAVAPAKGAYNAGAAGGSAFVEYRTNHQPMHFPQPRAPPHAMPPHLLQHRQQWIPGPPRSHHQLLESQQWV